MLGWLTFEPGQSGSVGGNVYWNNLPQPASKVYPAGFNFTNSIETSGSHYNFRIGTAPLNLTNGVVIVYGRQTFHPAVTNQFSLSAANKVTSSDKLNVAITITSGLFKGTAFNPATGTSIPISGVLLQNQTNGFGFFINDNESGSVYFGPITP